MGSARNGWCKKLMAKAKAHNMKRALGTSNRFHVDRPKADGPTVKERDGLPRKVTTRRRARHGCVLSPEVRAIVEARAAKREAFLAGLKG